jgi:hypothetical protein
MYVLFSGNLDVVCIPIPIPSSTNSQKTIISKICSSGLQVLGDLRGYRFKSPNQHLDDTLETL